MSDYATPAPDGAQKFYFAAWRWHFYAGLYVIPFLLMLALTGFFMMLLTTLLPEYGDRIAVMPAGAPLAVGAQAAAAIAAVPGGTGVSEYTAPYDDRTPALITVTGPEPPVIVALDPYRGEALRMTPEGATWYALLEDLHGSLLIGATGDRLIEAAAGLGLVLIATGLCLWWPRDGARLRTLLLPDLAARGRALWKSLHRVTGFWLALLLAGFLLTGLAWAGIWGERWVQAWSTFPAAKWDDVPLSDETHAAMNHDRKSVPWTLEQTPLPESGALAGRDVLPPGTPLDLDGLYRLGRLAGFEGRFRIVVPDGPTAVWTLSQDSMSYDSPDPTADRTLHVDQFTGRVLADVRFADYGLPGKAMAVGIALHEGQTGLWNILLNGLFCLAVVFLCLSGVVMWWKRRPAGAHRLAAPPRTEDLPPWKWAAAGAVAVALALLFPLTGAVLAGVLLFDLAVLRHLPRLRRALS